jgi:TonB family protein
MKKIAVLFFALLCAGIIWGQEKKVAMLEPVVKGGSVTQIEKEIILATLEEAITEFPGYKAFTRVDVNQITKELSFQQNGMVDDAQRKKIGIMSGASLICVSQLTAGEKILIKCSLVDVESGEIVSTANQLLEKNETAIYNECRKLASKLIGKDVETIPFEIVEEKPKFQGKEASEFTKWIHSKLTYPQKAQDNNIQGTVRVSFTVNTDGTLSDIKSIKTVDPMLEDAVIEIIKQSPKWTPGSQQRKPVRVPYQVPIVFKLETSNGEAYNPDGIELVYVKGGGGMQSFYIGKYEVTQAQWQAIMGNNPSAKQDPFHPVTNVSWNDTKQFLAKLNEKTGRSYRLPTETEWKYAANGGSNGDTYEYIGSNNLDEVAWHQGNSGWYDGSTVSYTHKVGTKKPNSIGIYDMSGNVDEWCEDYYDNTSYRVLRGGSWRNDGSRCRLRNGRAGRSPGNGSSPSLGFRLVVPLIKSEP